MRQFGQRGVRLFFSSPLETAGYSVSFESTEIYKSDELLASLKRLPAKGPGDADDFDQGFTMIHGFVANSWMQYVFGCKAKLSPSVEISDDVVFGDSVY